MLFMNKMFNFMNRTGFNNAIISDWWQFYDIISIGRNWIIHKIVDRERICRGSEKKKVLLELLHWFVFDVTCNTCLSNCNLSLFWSLSLLEVKVTIEESSLWLSCIRWSDLVSRALQLCVTRESVFLHISARSRKDFSRN